MVKLGAFILPPKKLERLIKNYKKEIKIKYGPQKYLSHPPHCTLCVLDISKKSLNDIKKKNFFIFKSQKKYKIKNSEINLGIDLDMEDNESNLELQKFNIINNLYSNLAIYNSILENSYINGCVINTNEEEIFFTELISNLVYKNKIAKFSLDTPILNDIKGMKINNHRFSISNISKKSNDYIMKINVNENIINKNDIFKEGNYEDIILEILYEIKTFNSLLSGDIEKNLEDHYFITKI